LRCANAACLIALKQAAFGRTRPPHDAPVDRDYHDVHLLLAGVPDIVVSQLAVCGHEVRTRASDAIAQLASGGPATIAAARQLVRLGIADTQQAAEAEVRRVAIRIAGRLSARG
jgi:hypothetical protein